MLSKPLMQGRVALVTGASRGIGKATARLFAQHGATVVVNYNSSEQIAQQVVDEIVGSGGKAMAFKASVDNAEQMEAMVAHVEQSLGPIDTLVMNAAAVRHQAFGPVLEFRWDAFQDIVLGELAGIFFPVQVVVPRMIQRKQGNLIALSSTVSRYPVQGQGPHAIGKSGVDAYVKILATELGPYGIRVNAIAPGTVETEATAFIPEESKQMMRNVTPLRRIAQPEDIAGAILLLATSEAGFITGQYISVGGGIYMP